jgi:hypothetical protein
MKRTIIISLAICCLTSIARAQTPVAGAATPQERIYVATDKDNYLSGEIVWMKLITTDPDGAPLIFSKVGYVELVGEEQTHARARIEVRGGVGQGTLVLPSSLPTGWYRLVGYTRRMRGEGPGVFFEKPIGVVNAALEDVPRGSGADDGSFSRSVGAAPSASGVVVSSDRTVYSPRSEVRLTIRGIPADIHTLGVSVAASDPLGRLTAPGLGVWRPAPATPEPSDEELEVEWEGAVITGQLVSSETGTGVYSPSVLPLASFPGDAINLFSGSIDPSGRIVYRTARATGFDDLITTMRGSGTRRWRIDVDDPFVGAATLVRPLPTFHLEAIDRESVLRGSLAMQVQYSYVNDSLTREERPRTLFTDTPRFSYRMEEWRRFATMHEVITEFVNVVQFRRSGRGAERQWNLEVVNSDFGITRFNTLVLLDGVPIIDHDIIYNYNPLLVDRIDVYNGRYIFGNNLFSGIVAFYTTHNTYPELQPDPFTQIVSYEAPQSRRLFYAPDYGEAGRLSSRLPDFRHTLYWDADVEAVDGSANVRFFTSDLTGTYQVLVEGITTSGQPVSAVCELRVER